MTNDATPSPTPPAGVPRPTRDVDPQSQLRPGLRVRGEQNRALGTVAALTHDASGQLTALTVRHGLIRRSQTVVPAQRVKQVNADSVMLECNLAQFKRFPTS
jgi:hypothetical protein